MNAARMKAAEDKVRLVDCADGKSELPLRAEIAGLVLLLVEAQCAGRERKGGWMSNRSLIFRGLLLVTLLLFAGAAAAQIEVPFRLHSEQKMILVEAKIKGKPARLIVDTGSASTILSEKALGMSTRDVGRARFLSHSPGMRGHGLWTKVTINVGGAEWKEQLAFTMDLGDVSQALQEGVDGILGQDFLSSFECVVIDFKNRKLLLYK